MKHKKFDSSSIAFISRKTALSLCHTLQSLTSYQKEINLERWIVCICAERSSGLFAFMNLLAELTVVIFKNSRYPRASTELRASSFVLAPLDSMEDDWRRIYGGPVWDISPISFNKTSCSLVYGFTVWTVLLFCYPNNDEYAVLTSVSLESKPNDFSRLYSCFRLLRRL